MNQSKRYLSLDVYDKSEVQNILKYCNYFGWSLCSLQDSFSPTELAKQEKGSTEEPYQEPNKLYGLNFREYLSGKNPNAKKEEAGESLLSYTKIVLAKESNFGISPVSTEGQYLRLIKLENRIYENGAKQDYSYINKTKKKGDKPLVAGLIILALGLVALLTYYLFKTSSTENYDILMYVSYGIIALGALIFLPSCSSVGAYSRANKKALRKRKKIAKDYLKVNNLRHDYESMVQKGLLPGLNEDWIDLLSKQYGLMEE